MQRNKVSITYLTKPTENYFRLIYAAFPDPRSCKLNILAKVQSDVNKFTEIVQCYSLGSSYEKSLIIAS